MSAYVIPVLESWLDNLPFPINNETNEPVAAVGPASHDEFALLRRIYLPPIATRLLRVYREAARKGLSQFYNHALELAGMAGDGGVTALGQLGVADEELKARIDEEAADVREEMESVGGRGRGRRTRATSRGV